MKPLTSVRNFTPSSTALGSFWATPGFCVAGQIEQGHCARTDLDHHRDAERGGFDIAAVVDGAAPDVHRARAAGLPGVGPCGAAVRAAPRRAAIDRHLHSRHVAGSIRGGAGDGDRAARRHDAVRERAADRRGRRCGVVGRRSRHQARSAASRGCAPMSANRLTVACCMHRGWPARPRDHARCRAPRRTGRCRPRRPARRWRAGTGSSRGSQSPARKSSRNPGACRLRTRWYRTNGSARRAGSRCRGPRPTRSRACRSAARLRLPAPDWRTTCCARSAGAPHPRAPGSQRCRN